MEILRALCVSAVILVCGTQVFADAVNPRRISTFGRQPRVAFDSRGWLYIVFGHGNSIFFQSSPDGGKTFSEPRRVADVDGLMLGTRRGPQLSVTKNYITIAAISKAGALQAWRSEDSGASWSAPVNVNDAATAAREGLHALSRVKGDEVFATWLDLRDGKTKLFGARSRDGGKSWSQNFLVYQSPDGHICECCHPSVASDGKGRVYVMWRNWLNGARDMYVALSKDGGRNFAPAAKMGSGTWILKACPMDGGSLAVDAKGAAHTAWMREHRVYMSSGPDSETQLGDGMHPVLAPAGNGVHVIWQSNGSILLLRNQTKAPEVLGKGAFAAVASDRSRRPVVVWEDDQGILMLGL